MTAMLADLVAMVADEFTAMLADAEPANDGDEQVLDRLWAAGLLDIPDLIRILLRRAESERVAAAIRTARQPARLRFLQGLVSDEDSDVSAAAMALILARGRRRDRFDGPRLTFDDVSAEAAVALVNAIAAALRADLAKRLGPENADERLSGAAQSLLSRHDEGNRLDAKTFDVVHALDRAGRLDERLMRSLLEEGDVELLAESLARRAGIGFDCAWEHLTDGAGKLALLLRMAGISRELAGEFAASAAEVAGSDSETEIRAFDGYSDEEVAAARKWLRLDPAYRVATEILDRRNGQRAV